MKSILLTVALIATAVPALADHPAQLRARERLGLIARCIDTYGNDHADRCAEMTRRPVTQDPITLRRIESMRACLDDRHPQTCLLRSDPYGK